MSHLAWEHLPQSCIWRKQQEKQTSGMFCLPSCDYEPKPANRKTDGWVENKVVKALSISSEQILVEITFYKTQLLLASEGMLIPEGTSQCKQSCWLWSLKNKA